MRFISSAIHCAAASPFWVPGPRPSKASSAIALSRADRSAALMSGVVVGWPGYSAKAEPADRHSAATESRRRYLRITDSLRTWNGPKTIAASVKDGREVRLVRRAHPGTKGPAARPG